MQLSILFTKEVDSRSNDGYPFQTQKSPLIKIHQHSVSCPLNILSWTKSKYCIQKFQTNKFIKPNY